MTTSSPLGSFPAMTSGGAFTWGADLIGLYKIAFDRLHFRFLRFSLSDERCSLVANKFLNQKTFNMIQNIINK
ncbi:MAG: hypothetical protein KJ737_18965 [Proteobacteria bacterium]|nr:hypothetical protein [Pseudomonadota bacterium]